MERMTLQDACKERNASKRMLENHLFLMSRHFCDVGKVGYKEADILKKTSWKREESMEAELCLRNHLESSLYQVVI